MYQEQNFYNQKTKWILAFSIFLLAALGTFNRVFSLVAFAIFAYAVLFCSENDVLFLLVFSVSFANIFKVSPSAQSLFTYILIAYVGYQLFKGNILSNRYCVALVLMLMFLTAQFLMSVQILRSIKFIVNLLFIYFALYHSIGHERDVFFGYIGGVISSSVVSWLNIIPKLNLYIQYKSTSVNTVRMTRFSGMYGDPNYYSINIIISLCLAVILYYKKEIKTLPFALISFSLLFFAIITYSKSALLMLAIPVLIFFYTNSKGGRYFLQIVFLFGLIVFSIYAIAGKVDFLSTIIYRFQRAENLNQLTSGRLEIWIMYLKNFSQSFFYLLMGRGFGAELVNRHAAHNSYIDFLYYLGLIGTFLLVRLLYVTADDFKCRKIQKNFVNYSVLAVVLIMYFFLSELFYFDMPFHILITIMVLNMNFYQNNPVRRGSV